MEKLACGHDAKPLLVTAWVSEWDADDEQVQRDNLDAEFSRDWVTCDGVCVGWHICPICKKPDGDPWIEEHSNQR